MWMCVAISSNMKMTSTRMKSIAMDTYGKKSFSAHEIFVGTIISTRSSRPALTFL
jgi:hypothetical protein